MKYSDSKHIHLYHFLFRFMDHLPSKEELGELAEENNIKISILSGMYGTALRYDTIYSELFQNHDYRDEEIPFWFKRPRRTSARKSKAVETQTQPSPSTQGQVPLFYPAWSALPAPALAEPESAPPFDGPVTLSKVNIGNNSYLTVSVDPGASPSWQAPEAYLPPVQEPYAINAILELQERHRIQENFEAKSNLLNMMAFLNLMNNEQPDEGITVSDAYELFAAYIGGFITVFNFYNEINDKPASDLKVEQKPPKIEPKRMESYLGIISKKFITFM